MSSDAKPANVLDGLDQGFGPGGSPWKIGGVSIKPHASCRHTHPAVDAALSLRNGSEPSIDDIRHVRVETYGTALHVTDTPNPTNVYQAKFSLQYCTAQALLHGRVGLHDFSSVRLNDATIRDLIDRIEISVDPELDANYPRVWSARVTVEYSDGTSRQATVDAPKGDPENPVTWNEVVAKTRDLAAGTRYERVIDEVITRVVAVDDLQTMNGFLPVID
jgi:2-methylcitrate dehydratase PrpD